MRSPRYVLPGRQRFSLLKLTGFQAAALVRPLFAGQSPSFRVITLREPPKHEMIPFLAREHRGEPAAARPARIARVQVTVPVDSGPGKFFELLVDLDESAVVRREHLAGKHPYIDSSYMKAVEKACLDDQRIQAEINKLKLPPSASIIVEPWAYATDGLNDMSQRTTMVRICLSVKVPLYISLIEHTVLVLYATGEQ